MERIIEYRRLLEQITTEMAQATPGHGDIETVALCDVARDQYQVLQLGWNGDSRVFAVLLHVRIRDAKIWIERDGTAHGVATQLVEAGVSSDDIVLAFYPGWKRAYTDFAAIT